MRFLRALALLQPYVKGNEPAEPPARPMATYAQQLERRWRFSKGIIAATDVDQWAGLNLVLLSHARRPGITLSAICFSRRYLTRTIGDWWHGRRG